MYEHGICTMMLAEVINLVPHERAKRCRPALRNAVRLILEAQKVRKPARHAGGWRYLHTSADSDLTVTGWQLSALRAAQLAGFEVPKSAFDQATDYVKRTVHPRTEGFGYQPGGNPTAIRCGVGIFALELCGKHKAKESIAAAKFIDNRPIDVHSRYMHYGCYHCSAGLYKLGGKAWAKHRKFIHDFLLEIQKRDGRWTPCLRRSRHGPAHDSAFAILSLTLERGHLPVYRR